MKRTFCFAVLFTFMLTGYVMSADTNLDTILNSSVIALRDAKTVTLSNIKINASTYWVRWSLDDNLDFKLKDFGEVSSSNSFDYMAALNSIYKVEALNPTDSKLTIFNNTNNVNDCYWFFHTNWIPVRLSCALEGIL